MRIVASLSDPADIEEAVSAAPDLIEFRLDLMEEETGAIRDAMQKARCPRILTLRSVEEGGRFAGDLDLWRENVAFFLPFAEYIDIERRFSEHAPAMAGAGRKIIASCHLPGMPAVGELEGLAGELRRFGDIPKIVVTPAHHRDVIALLRFTLESPPPIVTGVMGTSWRWVRGVLPLFGSDLVYCHVGRSTATGQYSVEEFRRLVGLLQ